MGCDSSESNFNNSHYDKGQWWCTSGWDYSYEGPWEALVAKLGSIAAPSYVKNEWRYSVTQVREGEDRWLVKPVGKQAVLLEKEAIAAQEAELSVLLDGVDPMAYYGQTV